AMTLLACASVTSVPSSGTSPASWFIFFDVLARLTRSPWLSAPTCPAMLERTESDMPPRVGFLTWSATCDSDATLGGRGSEMLPGMHAVMPDEDLTRQSGDRRATDEEEALQVIIREADHHAEERIAADEVVLGQGAGDVVAAEGDAARRVHDVVDAAEDV